MLPDCLASHLSGSLDELETVVDAAERGPSVEKTGEVLRPDIELPGAVRWTRRRLRMIGGLFTTLIGLMPERFASCAPTLASFRAALATPDVLVTLRAMCVEHLAYLPTPVGFAHRRTRGRARRSRDQQRTGRDPPTESG